MVCVTSTQNRRSAHSQRNRIGRAGGPAPAGTGPPASLDERVAGTAITWCMRLLAAKSLNARGSLTREFAAQRLGRCAPAIRRDRHAVGANGVVSSDKACPSCSPCCGACGVRPGPLSAAAGRSTPPASVTPSIRWPGGARLFACLLRHDLPDALRSDRVIATAWDATFALFDGIPTEADIDRLARNVPKQEAGRVSDRELSLSRAKPFGAAVRPRD